MPAKLTHNEYLQRVFEVHGKAITVLGKYVNAGTKILHRCNKCLHEWSPKPVDVYHSKSGCPSCWTQPLRRSHSRYVLELRQILPTIKPLEEYRGYVKKILHQCILCKHQWRITPNNTLFGHGCPACKVESNSFKRKVFLLGSREVHVQGYEPQALRWLLEQGVNPKNLLVSTREGKPAIPYTYKRKQRVYVPDFYHTKKNRVIEVKSTHTLGLRDNDLRKNWKQMQAKAKACIDAGYDFVLMLMKENGERIKLPKDWYMRPRKEVMKLI